MVAREEVGKSKSKRVKSADVEVQMLPKITSPPRHSVTFTVTRRRIEWHRTLSIQIVYVYTLLSITNAKCR